MTTHHSIAKRILVVEDEPAISEVCLRVLTSEGFEVDIAVNSKVAQDMIEKQQYDLFLFDIRLPVMTGIELYQWLQEKYPHLARRVIFVGGDVMAGDTRRFLEMVNRPFLSKPFTLSQLGAWVTSTAMC